MTEQVTYHPADLDPINDPANESDETTAFACACGDDTCIGYDDDVDNIRIGRAWYAADCVMANNHPWVVEGREQQAREDERGDK